MARGQQKIQAQQKNAEKRAKQKKGTSQLAAREAGYKAVCSVCMANCSSAKILKQHYEAKHPKLPLPAECVGI